MNENNNNKARFNDLEYYFTVQIFNNLGDNITLTQTAIKNLTIVEDAMSPFVDATMVIDNSLDVMQRGYKTADGNTIPPRFIFNKADYDYVTVEIKPIIIEGQTPKSLADTVWNLKYGFRINEIIEIPTEDPEVKFKQLNLIDYYKDEADTSSKFSTAKYAESDKEEYLQDNEDRMITTGMAIKKIIEEFMPNSTFNEEFDTTGNNIFYTSPIGFSYNDDLMYMYDQHQNSDKGDFCILTKQRSSEVWHLEKFSSIVSKALDQGTKNKSGEYQIEGFVIAEGAENEKIPQSQRVPTDYGINRNVSFGDYSKIENFTLSEASDSDDNMETIIAHSYDYDRGEFRIEYYDINDTVDFYQREYSDKMRVGPFNSSNIFNVRADAEDYDSVMHRYASIHDSNNTLEFASRNKVLKSAYLLSVGIEFSVSGMTNRKSNRFFSIRKENEYVSSDYENKLQGQWYAVRVEHVFSESDYTNNILGMKINKLEES